MLSKLLHLFQPNFASGKDNQILCVGGPNTRKTAAILKNQKIAIYEEWFDKSAQNLAW